MPDPLGIPRAPEDGALCGRRAGRRARPPSATHLAVESLKAEFEAKVRDHQPASSEIDVPEMERWSCVYDDARDYELFTTSFAARGYGSMRPIAIDRKNGWFAKVAVSLRQENGTYFVGEFRYELLNAYRQKVYAWTESPD